MASSCYHWENDMKVIYKGKAIEVPDSHGRLLVKSGRAKLSAAAERQKEPAEQKKDAEPAQPAEQTAMTSRTYKRRDMAAEDGDGKAKG